MPADVLTAPMSIWYSTILQNLSQDASSGLLGNLKFEGSYFRTLKNYVLEMTPFRNSVTPFAKAGNGLGTAATVLAIAATIYGIYDTWTSTNSNTNHERLI